MVIKKIKAFQKSYMKVGRGKKVVTSGYGTSKNVGSTCRGVGSQKDQN